jgi:hypothetical protein
LKANDSKKMLPNSFICILILAVSLHALNTTLVNSHPILTDENHFQLQFRNNPLNANSSLGLVVDIYTDRAGRGQNVSIGSYTVGDQIKFYVYVSENCSFRLNLITPDGAVWNRMVAPISAGTFVYYVDAEYPIGTWKIETIAQQRSNTVTETAPFEVVEKAPYTCTKTCSLNSTSTIEEAKFDGKVVNVYLYPVGGVYGWDILVDKVYFGPEISNLTVTVQVITYNEAVNFVPDYRPGYVDHNITLGDQVEVYGLFSRAVRKTSVTLNGSENYYIKRSSTLCESPELILFTREVFPGNLSVRIDGIAIPGTQNESITKLNWNWGDGQSSDQQFPGTHTYSKPGNYSILIKALQSNGLSTTKSLSISVAKNTLAENIQTTIAGASTGSPTNEKRMTETETTLETSLVAITLAAIALALIATTRSRTKKPSKSSKPNHN